jgi:UDP-3-O-[3-hydroxymyristoyl] glucosamine N-acyltransferase
MEAWAEPEMTMRPVALSELAARNGLTLSGPDREIVTIGAFNTRSHSVDRMLTFVAHEGLIPQFRETRIGACVVNESLAPALGEESLLVTDGDPIEAFYSLFIETARGGMWEKLEGRRGQRTTVAESAVVHEHVQLGDDCLVMDNAVVMPNVRLGDRVTVKPNATVGSDGFEVREVAGRRQMVPHCGGVWIGDDVQVGAQTCVDRGMFGGFTVIDDETRTDNLVHVGHSARLGPRGVVAASAEIGTVTAGEGFWLGPRSAVLQNADIGHHAYIGIGSVVVRPIPPHALAYGSPARQHGWVCSCREKLDFDDGRTTCRRCGRGWEARSDGIVEPASRS